MTIYDFHATLLHLLGIDHTQLTYYHNGIRRRLTDVHGEVVEGILADCRIACVQRLRHTGCEVAGPAGPRCRKMSQNVASEKDR